MGFANNVWPAWFIEDMLKEKEKVEPKILFCYGILKRGFSLDLEKMGGKFLGEAILKPANLYRIGDGVGLRIEDDGKVYGEVFEISNDKTWLWLDRIEGHPYTYMRQLVQVDMVQGYDEHLSDKQHPDAWTYVHQHPEYMGELIESGNYENNSEYARG